MEFNIGTHIVVRRLGYTHHGIYIGYGKVIHYSGFHELFKKGIVKETTLEEFANGSKVKEYSLTYCLRGKQFDSEEIVKRAKSKINEDNYNLLFNNCEHFANWCTHGDDYSSQTEGTIEHNIRSGNYAQAGGLTLFDVISPLKIVYSKINKRKSK